MTKCEIVLQNVKMSDVLARYGFYVKKNRNLNCPLHNDKNPSAVISKDDKWLHCYSCQKNVNVIDFVAEKEHCNRSMALKILNDMFSLGLDGKLSDEQKLEMEIKKRAEEKRKLREKNRKEFEEITLNAIIARLKYWEKQQKKNHPTRGQVKKNTWTAESQNAFFQAIKNQHWLNWLYDRLCGFNQYDFGCEFDFVYGTDSKELLRQVYKNNLKIV